MTENVNSKDSDAAVRIIHGQISEAIAASKCHACGCLQSTVEAIANTEVGKGDLTSIIDEARKVFKPKETDCRACPVCYPAVAANAYNEAFSSGQDGLNLCPVEEPVERRGWPPLLGDYKALRYQAPVAVCTLNSSKLMNRLAEAGHPALAIVGTMHTENLGIERVIRNVLANPNIRFLVLCGEDTKQAIGHLPGQSTVSLFGNGINQHGRIIGARGRRPLLKNVTREQIKSFLVQVRLIDLIGEESTETVLRQVTECASHNVGPTSAMPTDIGIETVKAVEPDAMIPDPAGFFVIYPDAVKNWLVVEHYTTAGVLDCIVEGISPGAVYATIVARRLITRLDHAAYLGRELARAERSVLTGEMFVQDRAPGKTVQPCADSSCDCTGAENEGAGN